MFPFLSGTLNTMLHMILFRRAADGCDGGKSVASTDICTMASTQKWTPHSPQPEECWILIPFGRKWRSIIASRFIWLLIFQVLGHQSCCICIFLNREQTFATKCQHLVARKAFLKQLSSEKHATVWKCGCKMWTMCTGVINVCKKMCCFISIMVINHSCGFASKEFYTHS